jgi:Spy/CpxP family protein refolding chaperone
MWNPRFACGVALALVFLCGAAVGALVMDFGVHNRTSPPAFDSPQGRAAFFDRMNRELKLTPAQSEQMRSILTDAQRRQIAYRTDSQRRSAPEVRANPAGTPTPLLTLSFAAHNIGSSNHAAKIVFP